MTISVQKLIGAKLADGKILKSVEKDGKYSKSETAALKKPATMWSSIFVSKNGYVPNPLDPRGWYHTDSA